MSTIYDFGPQHRDDSNRLLFKINAILAKVVNGDFGFLIRGSVAPTVGGTAVSESNPLPVTGLITNPSGSFSRPADTTAYAIGDLVANSTTAGSVTPISVTAARVAGGSFMLRRLKLKKTNVSTTNAQFRIHIYSAAAAITCTNGDNGAWSTNQSANYIGAFDVIVDRVFTDGSVGMATPVVGFEMSVDLSSGTDFYALIEARAAYTPTSGETFTVTVDNLPN